MMGATSRKEAGSGATLSSLEDAKAVSPAILLSSVGDGSPVSFVPFSVVATPMTVGSQSSSEGCPSRLPANFVNLARLLESGALGTIRWDEFTGTEVIEISGQRIRLDAGLTSLAVHCELAGLANVSLSTLRRVANAIAKANRFDSMKDWLSELPPWDGTKRVERFLPDYLSTPDQPYELAVGRYWWTAMVARILDPGHKVDMVPVLVGNQGVGKTKLLEVIPPGLEHHGTVCLTERPAELALKVLGKILIAWEELRGVGGRRDADEVKTFITNRYVETRSKSKIGMDQHLRRFIIVGTSNRRDFLRDPSGHRRYLPFDVDYIAVGKVKADKEQLWAEALHMVLSRQRNGQPLVDYQQAEGLAVAEHQKYLDQGRWVDDEKLTAWLQTGADKFRTEDALKIIGLGMSITRRDQLDMCKSLRQLGLDYRSTHVAGLTGKPKRWRQPKASSV